MDIIKIIDQDQPDPTEYTESANIEGFHKSETQTQTSINDLRRASPSIATEATKSQLKISDSLHPSCPESKPFFGFDAPASTSSASANIISEKSKKRKAGRNTQAVRAPLPRLAKDRARKIINNIVKGVVLQKRFVLVKRLRKRPMARRTPQRIRNAKSVVPILKPTRMSSFDSLASIGCSLCGHSCCARNC